MNDNSYTFLEILIALGRRWRMIITVALIAGILAFLLAWVMPKWYLSESYILPAYSSGTMMGALGALVGGVMGLTGEGSFNLPIMVTPTDLWLGIVKSPGIGDSIIYKYDFFTLFRSSNLDIARKVYASKLHVEPTGEGILIVGFESKDPQLSADITNDIVDILDRTLQNVHTTSARRLREFTENRLIQIDSTLTQASEEFSEFQKKYKVFSLEDQARAAIENLAQLYGQLSIYEVQLDAFRSMGISHISEIAQLEAQVAGTRRKLRHLQQKGDTAFIGVSLAKYPDLSIEYAKLYRDVKINEIVYEFVLQQYEQAKLEEQRNVKTLHVLSKAVPPKKKYKPKRAIYGAAAFAAGFFIMAFWVLWIGYLDKLKSTNPEMYHHLVGILKKRPK